MQPFKAAEPRGDRAGDPALPGGRNGVLTRRGQRAGLRVPFAWVGCPRNPGGLAGQGWAQPKQATTSCPTQAEATLGAADRSLEHLSAPGH